MTRLSLLGCAALLAAGFGYAATAGQRPASAGQTVTVYKSPT